MKVIVLEEFNKDLKFIEVPEPTLTDDGVILKIKANDIFRSDWHTWKGHWKNIKTPIVMGLEFTGVIEETGSSCLLLNWPTFHTLQE
ncbi:alcohol dehydrogenase catalytic domain-containing protein, partial [Bacillus sp. JJ1503]|uniref:alcohol dehydrogenase catalytic domain-containing protein n=1 Tax=Bacillus sp. JJ1503 TaxID=3122956 RepID=UPI003000CE35